MRTFWSFVDEPFKNREQVLAEIKLCAKASSVFELLSFLFAVLGVISYTLNTTLVLDPISWFLLAIFATVHGIVPVMHVLVAKHFLGIEAESKKE